VDTADVVAGLVIILGLLGVVVPLLPGTALIAVALVGWALAVSTPMAWTAAAAGLLVLGAGAVVKYLVPGRHLQRHGVPTRTLLAGGMLGVVGFFVIPVVGLVVGFVAGIYLAELARLGRAAAWPATKAALRAVGLAVLIELAAGLLATGAFVAGALST
jgi:uncharacterized protein YqgC (DUF456 family)